MNLPSPDFIPIPSSNTMLIISIVLLIVGICLICAGLLLFFLCKRKGKKTTVSWVCIVAGVLLMANHGIQILLNL
ncbi:hypothetical protein K413DRAFT_5319 [Clostridium sp. ASBs410]|jgi:uncharacterized membrane protein|nr:hypothetical protein K413DRAFT_5319 [Clostridium sp. ASBs410]